MATQRFPIRLGAKSRPLLRLFGVGGPDDAWVELGDDTFEARFGRFRAATPLSNIAGWRIEGPWRWITAIGVRRSIRHGDVSFAGDSHGGVRMDLRQKVAWGPFHVPAVWVGADELEGFADELSRLGIPGIDARKRRRGFRLTWPWHWRVPRLRRRGV